MSDELRSTFTRVWNCKGRHWTHVVCKPDDPCFGCEWRWEAVLTDKQARELGFDVPEE